MKRHLRTILRFSFWSALAVLGAGFTAKLALRIFLAGWRALP